jgi:hypothetical protein
MGNSGLAAASQSPPIFLQLLLSQVPFSVFGIIYRVLCLPWLGNKVTERGSINEENLVMHEQHSGEKGCPIWAPFYFIFDFDVIIFK